MFGDVSQLGLGLTVLSASGDGAGAVERAILGWRYCWDGAGPLLPTGGEDWIIFRTCYHVVVSSRRVRQATGAAATILTRLSLDTHTHVQY